MSINKADPPEDQREISLNETSLKRPLDVVDVIGGHGPWQFRQWVVFFVASLCNAMILFSALFLPSQTFCFIANSTDFPVNSSSPLKNYSSVIQELRRFAGNNHTSYPEALGNCNFTNCGIHPNDSSPVVSSPEFLHHKECWNSHVEIIAKCIYMVSCILSWSLVYFLTNRFGKRPVSLVSCLILLASSVATSWANAAAVFLILRFIVTLGIVNVYIISAFSMIEYVHKDYKIMYFLTGHLGWGMAHFILPMLAWLADSWRCFNLALSIVCMMLSLFVWWGPESPSFQNGGQLRSSRRALKYAAFTNGYSTTDVDVLSHSFHLQKDNTHDLGTPSSTRKKALWILYSCILFFMSFITAFLYFAAKWHTEWFKMQADKLSFAFLGSTEVAAAIILLFLTCMVSVKYLWACVSVMASALMIVIYSRTKPGSSKSSAMLYTGVVFFAAAAWTLLLTKSFCHRLSNVTAKLNLAIISVAVFAGSLSASAVILTANNQDLLLIFAVPHLIVSISSAFIPDDYFGVVA